MRVREHVKLEHAEATRLDVPQPSNTSNFQLDSWEAAQDAAKTGSKSILCRCLMLPAALPLNLSELRRLAGWVPAVGVVPAPSRDRNPEL